MPKKLSALQKMACPHRETSHEDGEGYAICVLCGAALPVRLTTAMLDAAMEAIKKRPMRGPMWTR